MSLITSVH